MTLNENQESTGFTMLTTDPREAFKMAEKMAFAGYSVKLSGVKGALWTVVVTETEQSNQHAITA